MTTNLKYEYKKLALGLFNCGAVKFGEFRLKLHEKNPDAPLSPVYIDLRVLRSFPSILQMAASALRELTSELKYNRYADVPTAATPIVTIMSNISRTPMISPRMTDKTHGLKGKIDGVFTLGQTVLLVDDLITKADSKLEAIAVLEENGLTVHDVAVLVDREQGGAQELTKRGYTCHSVFKLSGLVWFYLAKGLIDGATHDKVTTYLREN